MTPHATRASRALTLIVILGLTALMAGCAAATSDALGVNAVTADPAAFTGTIAVKGVVQNVDAATSSIVLIDEAEYATCGLVPCGSAGLLPLFLPTEGAPSPGGALYQGALPALEEVVLVEGEIKSSPEGLYFDVDRVLRGSTTLISKR